jgi:methyltransferase (TIGR00027 family)
MPAGPESSAERVALWRALHAQIDAPPHVIDDEIGLRLIDPPAGWQQRPDMDPEGTRTFRTSIVARARFIEDLVAEERARGVDQYVILGAGLDTFAQRRPEIASSLRVFEVDQPAPQAWKQQRLIELGYGVPDRLHFVPVDFEKDAWSERLAQSGFDANRPAVVSATGLSLYLTKEANFEMLRGIASFAPGSTLAFTFILPAEVDESVQKSARASGTPFLSFFTPPEMLDLGREAGFRNVRNVSGDDLAQRYFTNRTDNLRPSNGEAFLIATT